MTIKLIIKQIVLFLFIVALSPLLTLIITKCKSFWAGKKGPSLFYNYSTLYKLFQKSIVLSKESTLISLLVPIIICFLNLSVLFFLPFYNYPALFSFSGDILFVILLLLTSRFLLLLAGMDSGSSFQGMGVSRDLYYGILSEVVIFLMALGLYNLEGVFSFQTLSLLKSTPLLNSSHILPLLIILIGTILLLLQENYRVPVDDPNTHLELTMIHEVIILDFSGPLLAFLHLAKDLKLLFYTLLSTQMVWVILKIIFSTIYFQPFIENQLICYCTILVAFYLCIGVIESTWARFSIRKNQDILFAALGAMVLALLVIITQAKTHFS